MVLLGLFGALLGQVAFAEAPDRPDPPPEEAVAADAAERQDPEAKLAGKGPATTISEKIEEKSEAEKAREAKLAEIAAAMKKRPARVLVLQWKGSDTDYTNLSLQRNIKARIARPDATFYPELDLYQEGRTEPSRQVRPEDQRASVPASTIPKILSEVEATSAIPFDAIGEQEWGIRANELLKLADELWFIDRAELREPLFLLYAQIGRAAENANQGSPPFFANIDGQPVNYYWYLAGTLAHKDPSLLSKLTTQDLYVPISNYRDMLDNGSFRTMTLGFALSDKQFDPLEFGGQFDVYINGIAEKVTNINGLFEVPLGRADVFLKRADGVSLSAREERQVVPENFTYIVQNAQTRMGINFIEQLMLNPSECTPLLSGDIVNYLAVYGKMQPESDVYIAVPKNGSTAPGKIYLWRWDRERAQLFLVQDNTGGFPVRFAAVLGAGIAFGDIQQTYPTDEELAVDKPPSPGEQVDVAGQIDSVLPQPTLTPEGAPIFYQLRGHYNRVFMGVGMQFKIGLTGPDQYKDIFQTRTKLGNLGVKFNKPDAGGAPVPTLAFNERSMQRLVYGMLGVMLGKDAGVGFGPRGYIRYGWTNLPHTVDLTLHLGMTAKAPDGNKDEDRTGRVRGLLDLDFFGGTMLPYRDSFFLHDSGPFAVGKPQITFGFTAGAGLTF